MDETMTAETLPEADAFAFDEQADQYSEAEKNDLSGAADSGEGNLDEEYAGMSGSEYSGEAGDGEQVIFDDVPGKSGIQSERFTIPVKYNKQYRELSPEQATVYAQKGMKYESMEPSLNKLKYLAAASGETLSDVVDRLYAVHDETLMEKLMQRTGGDQALADSLFRAEKEKHGKAFTSVLMAEQRAASVERYNTNSRLAREFTGLQKEFPELDRFEKIPDAVVRKSALTGESLLTEYLLHRHREERRVAAVNERQQAAGRRSTGRQSGAAADGSSAAVSAMRRGVWE